MSSQKPLTADHTPHTQAVAFKNSLTFKMLIQLLAVIAVVLAGILVVLWLQLTNLVSGNVQKEITSLAEHNANLSTKYFDTMQTQSAQLADTIAELNGVDMVEEQKKALIQQIMGSMMKDERIFGVYAAWEPNAAFPDTPSGLSFYTYRSGSELKTDTQNDYDVYSIADYYATSKKTAAPHITEPFPYELPSGETIWLVTISNPIKTSAGEVLGVATCDIMADTINSLNYSLGSYTKAYNFMLSPGGAYLTNSRDKSLMGSAFGEGMKDQAERSDILSMITDGKGKLWEHKDEVLGEDAYIIQTPVQIVGLNETLSSLFVVSKSEALAQVDSIVLVVLLLSLLEMVVIGTGVILILRKSLRPMKNIISVAEGMERGELSADVKVAAKDEFGYLAQVFQRTTKVLANYVGEITSILLKIAKGDLRVTIENDYVGDFAPIKAALLDISSSLNNTLISINTAAEQVSTGASQVASGAQALAAGSTEQASSIEELNASITKIAEQSAENSANVKLATQYVEQASANVRDGSKRMNQLTGAMANIGSSSNQIANITKVIEDIAFQTNILALNAAIEAARAGNAGKGFAVVADEVRNLAAKSAEAAKQTAELIRRSAATVEEGTQVAAKTAQILSDIESKDNMVNESIMKVLHSSSDQEAAIEQVKQGLNQVSSVVQTNAATAEENSATSEEMSAQAAALKEEVGKFKLDNGYEKDSFAAISLLREPAKVNKAASKSVSALGKY
jgi:methyl-accepting chemotaxis protein